MRQDHSPQSRRVPLRPSEHQVVDHPPVVLAHSQVQEILWTLVVVLNLSKEDLVTAVVMFERCGAQHTGLFQPKAIRRFFLGCCIIARKVTCDTTIGLRWCWDRMRHVFTALTLKELVAIEAQAIHHEPKSPPPPPPPAATRCAKTGSTTQVFDIVQRRGGLTCNGAVYQAYADGLWEGANQVPRATRTRTHSLMPTPS